MVKKGKINYRLLVIKALRKKLLYFFIGVGVTLSFSYLFNIYGEKITSFGSFFQRNSNRQLISPKIKIEQSQIYEIKEGDYLWKIAEEQYGSGFNAYDIAVINKIIDPNNLTKGQKLILPKLTPKKTTVGETSSISTSQVVFKGDTYTVQPGDFLWLIAVKVYGDGYAADRIIKANNISNVNVIEPGTVLKIPK
jgi:nucleoid-associated protein YgaU